MQMKAGRGAVRALGAALWVLGAAGCGSSGKGSLQASHTVTATAQAGGSIRPGTASVADQGTATFTVTPDTGFQIAQVTGCGGTLEGNTYTTGPVTSDCTVEVRFVSLPVLFTNGQAAALAIGQPDLSTTGGGASPSYATVPYGPVAFANGVLYVPDSNRGRVLGFNALPATSGVSANFVLGAPDLGTVGTLGGAQAPQAYDGKLYVVQLDPTALLVFDPLPTAATAAPGAASPQAPAFQVTAATVGGFADPETIALGGGRMAVTDSSHNRVLLWDAVPSADNAPDRVLGQVDFAGTAANAGGSLSASTMRSPAGIWTDGTRLVVADGGNNRLLIWNRWPTQNGQPADLALGQPDFTSGLANQGLDVPGAGTLNGPFDGVTVNGNQLFVADTTNARVLIWNSWPTRNGQAADNVLGAPDLVSSGSGSSDRAFSGPDGITLVGNQLFVSDYLDDRVLLFNGTYAP